MGSIFGKDLTVQRPLSNIERIAEEIGHLKKGASVRYGNQVKNRTVGSWAIALAIGAALWLFFMDPFLYSLKKSDAINTYLYLRNCAGAGKADGLMASGIFSPDEIQILNSRHGEFQDYFASPRAAEAKADELAAYFKGVRDLQKGNYDDLDPVGKLRFLLFVRAGLIPPTMWSGLNPQIQ